MAAEWKLGDDKRANTGAARTRPTASVTGTVSVAGGDGAAKRANISSRAFSRDVILR
jgi:hypothetical protein